MVETHAKMRTVALMQSNARAGITGDGGGGSSSSSSTHSPLQVSRRPPLRGRWSMPTSVRSCCRCHVLRFTTTNLLRFLAARATAAGADTVEEVRACDCQREVNKTPNPEQTPNPIELTPTRQQQRHIRPQSQRGHCAAEDVADEEEVGGLYA
jgi:hypothetical protein